MDEAKLEVVGCVRMGRNGGRECTKGRMWDPGSFQWLDLDRCAVEVLGPELGDGSREVGPI